jgi:hypothetical protein
LCAQIVDDGLKITIGVHIRIVVQECDTAVVYPSGRPVRRR